MKQYLDLIKDVLENGTWKEPAREGMPRTKEIFCRTMTFNLADGFPLLTTKKMFTKGIVAELLWFLTGDTNIRYLWKHGVHIWDDDAYKYHKRLGGMESKEEWLQSIKDDKYYLHHRGDCGDIYGHQWRNFNDHTDQIKILIKGLRENPNSRYHIVTAWNPDDFLTPIGTLAAALPACHMMFQCSVRDGKLDLMMLQRSCDLFLGVPFNIASYALLTHLLAVEVGLEPGIFTWVGNSIHIYENHMEQVNEILKREPKKLCTLEFTPKSILSPENFYNVEDFKFNGYESYPAIKAPLSVGV